MANDYIPGGDAEFNGCLALDTPRSRRANPSQGDGRASHDAASQGLANLVTYADAHLADGGLLAGDMTRLRMGLRTMIAVVAMTNCTACSVHRQPIEQRLAPKLEQLKLGMSVADFKKVLPDAYPKGQKAVAGRIVDALEVKDTAADFHLAVYIPIWINRDEFLWFYFYNDTLVKWGRPGSWPSEPDLIVEMRQR